MILIKNGNAFELIKEIPDKSIDLILTDPPYDGTKYMKSLSENEKRTMALEFKRVLKDTGNIALFTGYNDKWKWYNILSEIGLKFIREIIWVYKNPSGFRVVPRGKLRKFIASHETILWFAKDEEKYYFNNDGLIELSWIEHNAFSGIIRLKGFENLPKEKMNVTPKPIKISDILVKRLCPKNGTILDPFMGFGTFGISSQKFGCNYIGFEIRKEIYEFAKKRLENLSQFGNL